MKAKLKKQTEFQLIFEPSKKADLKIGGWYIIQPYKKSRSKDQNALLWAILEEIQNDTGTNKWTIYLSLLEHTGVLIEYLEAPHEAEETLKRIFRIVKKVENRTSLKGKPTALYKCYVGSSNFKTNEMKILIDAALGLAQDLGIIIDAEASEREN